MWWNPQETVDLVTFTGEILNGKVHFFVVLLVPCRFFRLSFHCAKYRNFTYFIVWKFCENAQFPQSFGWIARNSAKTIYFHKFSTPENEVKFQHFAQCLLRFFWFIPHNQLSMETFPFDYGPITIGYVFIWLCSPKIYSKIFPKIQSIEHFPKSAATAVSKETERCQELGQFFFFNKIFSVKFFSFLFVPEMYLEPSLKSSMELFWENS